MKFGRAQGFRDNSGLLSHACAAPADDVDHALHRTMVVAVLRLQIDHHQLQPQLLARFRAFIIAAAAVSCTASAAVFDVVQYPCTTRTPSNFPTGWRIGSSPFSRSTRPYWFAEADPVLASRVSGQRPRHRSMPACFGGVVHLPAVIGLVDEHLRARAAGAGALSSRWATPEKPCEQAAWSGPGPPTRDVVVHRARRARLGEV